MMMLRRFSRSLQQQNWTEITIEFVLLVAGVYLGIQVSNWNESRLESEQAADNLQRIEIDLREDIAAMQRRERFWRSVAEHGQLAIIYAE